MDDIKQTLEEGVPTPDFLNQEEQALFAEATLGEETIRFLDSDLGRVLRGYALQERAEAKEAMLKEDPMTAAGRQAIRDHQFRAAVADYVLTFFREALDRGEVAYQSLKQLREQA
ncbi:hypothetical protein ACGTNG_12575 [Halomonas sp. 1390]|uniref:hypothetical protein n=1 Tax=Halomonas sp. B23F22_3 TaxID=3459516 RepID=UPI00373F2E09